MSQALLLSGGLDSVAIAAWKRPAHAITVDYGQLPAAGEIRASRKVCETLRIVHHVIEVNCRALGSGDLAGSRASSVAPVPEWWPYRNQMLVTFAAMKAIELGISELIVGSVRTDGEHVDGTAVFYEQLDRVVAMQEGSIRVVVPAIGMTSTALIRAAGVDRSLLAWCHSCHVSDFACGRCRGCRKHEGVLRELGYQDEAIRLT